jgi:hypothetical protein
MTAASGLWALWGAAEMYYEGWGQRFPIPLAYLIPGAICMLATAIVLTWPRVGGWLPIGGGSLFTAWWWALQVRRAGGVHLGAILAMFPVSGMLIGVGVLFLIEGQRRQRRRAAGVPRHDNWWLRNLHYVVALGVPLLTVSIVSATQLPRILTRVDDGRLDARRIEGNGVTLIWAPAGPGWNWRQPGGWSPSWDGNALYGVPPVGLKQVEEHASQADMEATSLCRYLNKEGTALMAERQDIWRMPTTDEIVRSLVRGGENAGCTWNGEEGKAACQVNPDKEMPLWSAEQAAIYYWTADEYDAERAWYVSYNGHVRHQPKGWGNPRHGHRCVRTP